MVLPFLIDTLFPLFYSLSGDFGLAFAYSNVPRLGGDDCRIGMMFLLIFFSLSFAIDRSDSTEELPPSLAERTPLGIVRILFCLLPLYEFIFVAPLGLEFMVVP